MNKKNINFYENICSTKQISLTKKSTNTHIFFSYTILYYVVRGTSFYSTTTENVYAINFMCIREATFSLFFFMKKVRAERKRDSKTHTATEILQCHWIVVCTSLGSSSLFSLQHLLRCMPLSRAPAINGTSQPVTHTKCISMLAPCFPNLTCSFHPPIYAACNACMFFERREKKMYVVKQKRMCNVYRLQLRRDIYTHFCVYKTSKNTLAEELKLKCVV